MGRNNLRNDPMELMRLAKEGSVEAFGIIYELYFMPVFRYIYSRVRDKRETEDLTQTVFVKAYQSVSGFQDINKPPIAYFFAIAKNTIIDYWRKRKGTIFGDANDYFNSIPDIKDNPQEAAEKSNEAEIIRQAMDVLTEDHQEVIIMKFWSGLSNKEIASILSKTEETVRQLQCRGLRVLRQYLNNNYAEGTR